MVTCRHEIKITNTSNWLVATASKYLPQEHPRCSSSNFTVKPICVCLYISYMWVCVRACVQVNQVEKSTRHTVLQVRKRIILSCPFPLTSQFNCKNMHISHQKSGICFEVCKLVKLTENNLYGEVVVSGYSIEG